MLGLDLDLRFSKSYNVKNFMTALLNQMSDDKLELCVGKLVPGAPASDILQKGDIIRCVHLYSHQVRAALLLRDTAGYNGMTRTGIILIIRLYSVQ